MYTISYWKQIPLATRKELATRPCDALATETLRQRVCLQRKPCDDTLRRDLATPCDDLEGWGIGSRQFLRYVCGENLATRLRRKPNMQRNPWNTLRRFCFDIICFLLDIVFIYIYIYIYTLNSVYTYWNEYWALLAVVSNRGRIVLGRVLKRDLL